MTENDDLTPHPDIDGEIAAMPLPDAEDEGGTSFALLVVALLVLVGGSVYFVGRLLAVDSETAAAQAQAEERILAEFDPEEFTSEFADPETSPSSLPLAEDETTTTTTTTPESTTTTTVRPAINPDDVVLAFVNRVPGDEYGLAGYIDRQGERQIVPDLECDRIDLNDNRGICLSATAGLNGSGRALILDGGLTPISRFGVNRPSRAAASPDGAVVAWTGFTLGHSYLAEGEFATTTQLISVDRKIAADLESIFKTYRNDELMDDEERNFWGVSFVDSDLFYATVGVGGETFIVQGRVSTSRMDVVFENASCPEVSPDGKTVVVKEQRGDRFQLIAVDVATGARRDLGETRSVDDQVEWADDNNILYGMANLDEGTDSQPVFDIYALNVAPGSQPRLVVPFAESPAA